MVRAREGCVLPVDKPVGPTSHDIVGRARRALDTKKVGHTGTLDPFASGLLLLCVGAATRLSQYLTGLEKTYEAEARLGIRTETLDPEGEVVETSDAWTELGAGDVREALAGFRGVRDQVPPQYSAKKVGGEAMYQKARRGERVELEPVQVEFHRLELLSYDPPTVRFRVRCSSGTYVRALARDLGVALGVPAHLTGLRRTRIGRIRVEDALNPDALDRAERVRDAALRPARAVAHLPTVRVGPEDAEHLAAGRTVPVSDDGVPSDTPLGLVLDGTLVAVGERNGSLIRPRKVFVDA